MVVTMAELMVTRHLAGADTFALCGARLGARVAVSSALALSEAPQHWYNCPACRAALGGTEPMKVPAGRRPNEMAAVPVGQAGAAVRGGSWAWDTSNYDYDRGGVDVTRAVAEGVAGMTAKVSEGTSYRDPFWPVTAGKLRPSTLTWWGPYHVLYPASMASIPAQVQVLVQILDATVPGWRTDPRCIPQLDAERFSYMSRAPSVAECNEFRARLIAARGGGDVLGYLPAWLYGAAASGYAGPLWSSSYVGGSGTLAALYPGDGGVGLRPYSAGGKPPELWQFTAAATIAGQHPCDGNVTRRPAAQLVNLVNGSLEDDMPFDGQGFKDTIINAPPPPGGPHGGQPVQGGMRIGDIIGWSVAAQASALTGLTSLDAKVTALATALANLTSAGGGGQVTKDEILAQLDKTIRDVLGAGAHAQLLGQLESLARGPATDVGERG
jgi:hypothetical protein